MTNEELKQEVQRLAVYCKVLAERVDKLENDRPGQSATASADDIEREVARRLQPRR